jgi:hypothetical protein
MASVWVFSWDVHNAGQGISVYATEAAAVEAMVAVLEEYTNDDLQEGDSMEELLHDARKYKRADLAHLECWYAVDEYEVNT